MKDVVMPAVGVAMTEGTLLRWLKRPGEDVRRGELVVEVETDKAAMELESPADGRLGSHLYEEGVIVPAGAALVRVFEPGDPDVAEMAPTAAISNVANQAPSEVDEDSVEVPRSAPDGGRAPHSLTPRARRLARLRQGDQPDNRAGSANAAERVDEAPQGLDVAAPPGGGRHRRLIADKVLEAWRTIPHFAVSREVMAESLLREREWCRSHSIPVTLTDLMLRSLALALRQMNPDQNSDLGLAVATEHGVVVPVIRDVAERSVRGLVMERQQAVERAKTGRLSAADLSSQPASTLSNLGAYGVDNFTGVIASGQASLLTVGRVRPRVVVENGTTAVVRNTFFATLNADHRIIDGADAAVLLSTFASIAEAGLQLEVADE